MATLLISHDLGVVASNADQLAVMYAGQIVENGSVRQVFNKPLHPYTQGLLQCVPRLGQKHDLPTIAGQLPDLKKQPDGCLFIERCPCPCAPGRKQVPQMEEIETGHWVRCWRD